MKFYNHCNHELFSEAKKIIDTKDWHSRYKEQLLARVESFLEVGQMVRTNTGMESRQFKVSDVCDIVVIVSDRDN